MNLALKIAILKSGLTAREVGLRARIPESVLSRLIHRHIDPMPQEKEKLARVLQVDQDVLFPPDPVTELAS
jgi:hypothetical protein